MGRRVQCKAVAWLYRAVLFLLAVYCPVSLGQAEELHDVIDREIAKHAGGPVAGPADDAEFLRGGCIDLTGKLPN